MRKKYISKNDFNLSTYIKVGDKEVAIRFQGGFKSESYVRNGFFITADKELQKAIESSAGFNVKFYLDEDSCIKDEQKETPEAYLPDLIELDASKKQDAIEQLISVIPSLANKLNSQLPNAQIEAMAKENGYTFVNLKIA